MTAPIFLLVGSPAVGKSTTARALAAKFPKGIYIPVDDVRDMVVSGRVLPGPDWGDALIEQLVLARESVTQMALAYNKAGFAVAIDDFWDPVSQLAEYTPLFSLPQVCKVVLYPREEVAHARNLKRSGGDMYIEEGIRFGYRNLNPVIATLRTQGWLVLDTTDLDVEASVSSILAFAEVK